MSGATYMVPAVHVAPGMILVHHETRAEYRVLQNAKVNRVIVVSDPAGATWKAPYLSYDQIVEVKPGDASPIALHRAGITNHNEQEQQSADSSSGGVS